MAKMKKFLSLAMVAVLCTASVMPALAEDVVETPVVEAPVVEAPAAPRIEAPAATPAEAPAEPFAESSAGSMVKIEAKLAPAGAIEVNENPDTGVTVTTTTKTDDDGKGTVTVTIEEKWNNDGDTDAEAKIAGEQTTVTTTVDTDRKVTTTTETEGSETKEWSEEIEPGEADVTVDLVPGEKTEASVPEDEKIITEVTGDVPNPDDKTDENYDYTKTITTVDRTVTAETSESTVTNVNGDVDLKPVAPDIYSKTGSYADGNYQLGQYNDENATVKKDILQSGTSLDYYGTMEWVDDPSGEGGKWVVDDESWTGAGDYQYAGKGERTNINVGYEDIVYEKDENGDPVKSTSTSTTKPIQFVLHDEEGNIVFAYCIDLETSARGGHYYDVSNLEDSDYYADETSEDHLRAIVLSGYWGSANEKDENGDYATGSIEAIRQELASAFAAGKLKDEELTFSTKNENGEEVEEKIKLSELMGSITEGEALAVTQAAIWTYANGSSNPNVVNSTAERVVTGTFGDDNTDAKAKARLDTFYKYLISITAQKTDNTTTVINEKNNVKDVSLTVKNKTEGHANNQDEYDTNDVYDTDLNFKLAFIPGENDDLLVCVTYQDMDGIDQTVVKRLAGENTGDQAFETINPVDGVYTIPNLTLSENKNFNFDLKLEGLQYLEQGVYVYSPVGGRGASQTFVGVAEGTRDVNVSREMTITFDVDEEKNVVAEHKWKKKVTRSRSKTTTTTTTNSINEDPSIITTINEEGVPMAEAPEEALVEILDEEVPLAAAPETGDNSIIYMMVSLISLVGAAVLALKRRSA